MGPVPRVCIPLRAVPPRRDASHARIPNAYRQLWMSLRRRLFHTHTHKRTSQKFPAFRFLPYALISLCRSHAPLCIRLLGNSCPGIEANNLSFSWKIISFHRYLVHSKILPSLEIVENCFFLTLLFTSFWKFFAKNFEKIISFEKNFVSYSNVYLSFGKFREREGLLVWRGTCQKIETIIVEEVFFIRGEKFWRWKLVSNLISLFRRGKN